MIANVLRTAGFSPRKVSALLLAFSTLSFAADSLNIFGYTWTVPNAADWKIEDGVLRLLVGREPLPGPRRPYQFAIASTRRSESGGRSRSAAGQPLAHDRVRLSRSIAFRLRASLTDSAQKQPVHNGVFHVYGGERVRISRETVSPLPRPSIVGIT